MANVTPAPQGDLKKFNVTVYDAPDHEIISIESATPQELFSILTLARNNWELVVTFGD